MKIFVGRSFLSFFLWLAIGFVHCVDRTHTMQWSFFFWTREENHQMSPPTLVSTEWKTMSDFY